MTAGSSLAKLGPDNFPATTTCQFWNEFSRDIGADINSIGAGLSETAAYYAMLGYGSAQATDGPFETAVEEASSALQRGCDVAIHYVSDDGQKGHVEMVEQIVIDPSDSQKATVHTLSWGQHESVSYDNGDWSGKTDGNRYGTENCLQRSGKATFYYYCKE